MWSYDIVDTRTGALQSPVFPSSGSWNRVLNDVGSGSHTFPNAMPLASRASYRALLQPWARTLVVSLFMDSFGITKKAVYAGMIQSRSFDFNTGELTIEHADVRSLFSRRYTFGTNGYSGDTADNKLELTNKTLASIAPWIVTAGTVLGYASNYLLPMTLTEGGSAGTDSRTYFDYNFTTVEAGLTEVQDLGPDTDFPPVWVSSGIQWQMRCGTPSVPRLSGPSFDWVMTSAAPGIFNLKVTEDATKQATASFAIGIGSEVDMKVATSRVASSLPALERSTSYKGADQGQAVLQAHADADLAAYKNPTEQWSFSMLASSRPESIVLGSTHRLYFRDHGWVDDGWHDLRVIGFSADMTDKISFSVQPIGGV
jgi:hypothetical protein